LSWKKCRVALSPRGHEGAVGFECCHTGQRAIRGKLLHSCDPRPGCRNPGEPEAPRQTGRFSCTRASLRGLIVAGVAEAGQRECRSPGTTATEEPPPSWQRGRWRSVVCEDLRRVAPVAPRPPGDTGRGDRPHGGTRCAHSVSAATVGESGFGGVRDSPSPCWRYTREERARRAGGGPTGLGGNVAFSGTDVSGVQLVIEFGDPAVPALSPWSRLALTAALIAAGMAVWRRRAA